jgi:cation:H+ antiporter
VAGRCSAGGTVRRHPVAVLELLLLVVGVGLIVWGAEMFAEHLVVASARLGVSTFALAVLLAGAEPEELATAITAGARGVPAVAFGDVVGANAAICLVALPVAALIAPLPFSSTSRRYALLAVPAGALAVAFAWDGAVGRVEGTVLVATYVAYVAIIWVRERRPPSLGETGELDEDRPATGTRISRELVLVVVGTAAIVVGASLLVEAVRRVTGIEADQTRLALTVVGFATAFELVVLAWSSARRGITDAVVAAVVGSFAYNVTMTLGAAAVLTPLEIADASLLHLPMLTMMAALIAVVVLSARRTTLTRLDALALIVGYGLFVSISTTV